MKSSMCIGAAVATLLCLTAMGPGSAVPAVGETRPPSAGRIDLGELVALAGAARTVAGDLAALRELAVAGEASGAGSAGSASAAGTTGSGASGGTPAGASRITAGPAAKKKATAGGASQKAVRAAERARIARDRGRADTFRRWVLDCATADSDLIARAFRGGAGETGRRFLIVWSVLSLRERESVCTFCGIDVASAETCYRAVEDALFPPGPPGKAQTTGNGEPAAGNRIGALLLLNRIEASLLFDAAPVAERNLAILELLSHPGLAGPLAESGRYDALRAAASRELSLLYQSIDTECIARLSGTKETITAARRVLGSSPSGVKLAVVDSGSGLFPGRCLAFVATAGLKDGTSVSFTLDPGLAGPVYARAFAARLMLRLPATRAGQEELLGAYGQTIAPFAISPAGRMLAARGQLFGRPEDRRGSLLLARYLADGMLRPAARSAGVPLSALLPGPALAAVAAVPAVVSFEAPLPADTGLEEAAGSLARLADVLGAGGGRS